MVLEGYRKRYQRPQATTEGMVDRLVEALGGAGFDVLEGQAMIREVDGLLQPGSNGQAVLSRGSILGEED